MHCSLADHISDFGVSFCFSSLMLCDSNKRINAIWQLWEMFEGRFRCKFMRDRISNAGENRQKSIFFFDDRHIFRFKHQTFKIAQHQRIVIIVGWVVIDGYRQPAVDKSRIRYKVIYIHFCFVLFLCPKVPWLPLFPLLLSYTKMSQLSLRT